jgi:hypothetical protein
MSGNEESGLSRRALFGGFAAFALLALGGCATLDDEAWSPLDDLDEGEEGGWVRGEGCGNAGPPGRGCGFGSSARRYRRHLRHRRRHRHGRRRRVPYPPRRPSPQPQKPPPAPASGH